MKCRSFFSIFTIRMRNWLPENQLMYKERKMKTNRKEAVTINFDFQMTVIVNYNVLKTRNLEKYHRDTKGWKILQIIGNGAANLIFKMT